MKRVWLIVLVIPIITLGLTGFVNTEKIEVTIVATSFDKCSQTLRYDIKIRNKSKNKINENINVAITPWKDLEKLMVIDKNNEFKMSYKDGSKEISGYEAKFQLDYKVKNNVDYSYLMDISTNANLFIVDDNKVVKKVSLRRFRNY